MQQTCVPRALEAVAQFHRWVALVPQMGGLMQQACVPRALKAASPGSGGQSGDTPRLTPRETWDPTCEGRSSNELREKVETEPGFLSSFSSAIGKTASVLCRIVIEN